MTANQWSLPGDDSHLIELPVYTMADNGRGYVYILRAKNGYTKIGMTVNMASRIARHRRKWRDDFDFRILGIISTDNCEELERRLHAKYANKRVANRYTKWRWEWFVLSDEDVADIAALGGAK
jgi:predicted GIY-YIG superfamily endonuclease